MAESTENSGTSEIRLISVELPFNAFRDGKRRLNENENMANEPIEERYSENDR